MAMILMDQSAGYPPAWLGQTTLPLPAIGACHREPGGLRRAFMHVLLVAARTNGLVYGFASIKTADLRQNGTVSNTRRWYKSTAVSRPLKEGVYVRSTKSPERWLCRGICRRRSGSACAIDDDGAVGSARCAGHIHQGHRPHPAAQLRKLPPCRWR